MLLKKRNHIIALLQVFLVICTFSSCMDDGSLEKSGLSVSDKATGYLAIQLKFDSNTSVTRATQSDFGKSTDDEYEMGPSGNIAIFFKKNENTKENELFGIYNLESKKKEDGTSDYEDAEYLYIQQLPATDDDIVYPTSCLVVLNGNETITSKLKQYEETNKSKIVKAEDILKEIWVADPEPKDIGYSDKEQHKYFTMTNSVYYNANTLYTPTEFVAKEHIFQTIDSAKADPITVHAERLLAKFTLDEKVSNGTYAENVEGKDHTYTIKDNNTVVYCDGFTERNEEDVKSHAPKHIEKNYQVKLTGWGMNALETQTQLFKKIQNKEYYKGWNDQTYYRSYWSEDPHYDYETGSNTPLKYPWQYRLAVNHPLDYYKEKYPIKGGNNENYLKNYTFEELNNSDFTESRIVYTPENTYDPSNYNMETDFDSRTELLAGTHLIVGAELLTNFTQETYEAKDVYRDRKGVFYKNQKDCFWALVRELNYALQSQVYMKYNYYNWESGGIYNESRDALTMKNYHYIYEGSATDWDEETDKALDSKSNKYGQHPRGKKVSELGTYKLYRKVGNDYKEITYDYIMSDDFPDEFFIPANVKDGDGKMLPWIDGLTIRTEKGKELIVFDEINIRYDHGDGGITIVGNVIERYPANKEADNEPNSNIQKSLITDDDIKSFILEWMGAVDHFKDGKMYYAAPVKHNAATYNNNDPIDRSKVGEYGVVRNNWYKFKLNDIIGIGTSVDNPDDPIVPNKVTTNDQLNITVDILPWHTFNFEAPVL